MEWNCHEMFPVESTAEPDTTSGKTEQNDALLAFLGTFPAVDGDVHTESLNDGVQILDCLCEIAPDHFQPNMLHRQQLDNWILRLSNLRKILRSLEVFFATELHRSVFVDDDLTAIAKGAQGMQTFLQLVATAAVNYRRNHAIYVKRILEHLSVSHQSAIQTVLEQSVCCPKVAEDTTEPTDEVTETTSVSLEPSCPSTIEETAIVVNPTTSTHLRPSSLSMEHDDSGSVASESSSSGVDWQNRCLAAESRTATMQETLDEIQGKYEHVQEKSQQLADDLDVAIAAQQQLYRAQATSAAYKTKWEEEAGAVEGLQEELSSKEAELIQLRKELQVMASRNGIEEEEEISLPRGQQQPPLVAPTDSEDARSIATMKRQLHRLFTAYTMKTQENARLSRKIATNTVSLEQYQEALSITATAQSEVSTSRERIAELERELGSLTQSGNQSPDETMALTIQEWGWGML